MIRNFCYVIDNELAGSAAPGSWGNIIDDLEQICAKGIKRIITLTEEPLPRIFLDEYNFESLHIPIQDYTAPSVEQIFKTVEYIEESRKQKKPVLVHCHAGIGRTGTMLAAYFVYRGYTTADAVKHIRNIRFGSIETDEQIDAIYQFEQVLKKNNEG